MRFPKFERPSGSTILLFAAIWLAVGFASGTLTLLGPVRWVTSAMRDAGQTEGAERLAVVAIIAAYVTASFLVSVVLTRFTLRQAGAMRAVAPAGAWIAAAACLWLWMTPAVINGFQPVQVDTVARFTFGPYPERERFEQLREDGFTAVVSLLHPAVVPFEPKLLSEERALAEEFGIELIHAPMLPWVGDNSDSLALLRELAQRNHGRYYVHCYLGRDRVGAARGVIERSTGAQTADVRETPPDVEPFDRERFERGPIFEIDQDVFVAPFPTDEEMFAHVAKGKFATVVSLLDPDNPDDVKWIDKERQVLGDYAIPFVLQPVPWMKYSAAAARDAAEAVRTATRPVLVHAFRSEGTAANAFIAAYRTGLLPVAEAGFDKPMTGGQAAVLATNLVVGPRPTGPEFGNFLKARGIRSVIYVGDGATVDARHDQVVAEREAELEFRAMPADAGRIASMVAVDGPWFVYGPGLGAVQRELETRFAANAGAEPATLAGGGQ